MNMIVTLRNDRELRTANIEEKTKTDRTVSKVKRNANAPRVKRSPRLDLRPSMAASTKNGEKICTRHREITCTLATHGGGRIRALPWKSLILKHAPAVKLKLISCAKAIRHARVACRVDDTRPVRFCSRKMAFAGIRSPFRQRTAG